MNGNVEIYNQVEPLRGAWEDLARRTESRPFLWPGWIEAWWEAFGEGELQIFAAFHEERLVGVLPLRCSEGILSSTENEEVPLYGFLAESETAARQLLEALFSRGAHRIDLTFLDYPFVGSREAFVSLVRETAAAADLEVLVRSPQKVPYVDLSETTWNSYEGGLRKKLRSELRRRRRRLEEEGELTLEVSDGKEGLKGLLEEGFRVEGSGWKSAAGTSINSDPATLRFYTEAAHWAAEYGSLRLYFLRLDGRVLAFDYCLQSNGILYALKGGYDPAYAKFSPGMILCHMELNQAFDEGFTTYELLGGFEPWKREWSNAHHELSSLHMFVGERKKNDWYYDLYLAVREFGELIPPGETFVLIDEDSWQVSPGARRQAVPFIERDGQYWGPPSGDEVAVVELERLRREGANFVVVGWPAFWWLEYYEGLHEHLRSRFRCLLENERMVVFDLRKNRGETR